MSSIDSTKEILDIMVTDLSTSSWCSSDLKYRTKEIDIEILDGLRICALNRHNGTLYIAADNGGFYCIKGGGEFMGGGGGYVYLRQIIER